ncbi:unnamed protein product, partial [Nesidiocoris tenuis]
MELSSPMKAPPHIRGARMKVEKTQRIRLIVWGMMSMGVVRRFDAVYLSRWNSSSFPCHMGCPRVAFIISASRYLGKTPALSRKDTRRTNAVISGQSAKRFVKEGRSLKVWRSRGSEFE